MLDRPSRWAARPYSVAAARRLAGTLGLPAAVASILVRRGFDTPEAAQAFLGAEDRHDPHSMFGVREACATVLRHVERGSRIVVFGDYDVDGVCATAILTRTLGLLGAEPRWRLPSRLEDGYGLTPAAVERLRADGAELLVTVDCGVTAVEEVAAARTSGMEVVVTDHHRPGEGLPDCALVHPGLGGSPFPELCAAGVVLKLSEALLGASGCDPALAEADLDLAALATVCDMVPMRGENRRIARSGLSAMARSPRPGLAALMKVSSLDASHLSAGAVAFRLGPRINAAGRLRRADAALELLLTSDDERAAEVAAELDTLNHERRETEVRMLHAANSQCAGQAHKGAIVAAGEGWHPGVVGIVASRLVERWHRPCVVIALEGGSGRGSGRSIEAYDLHAGLSACSNHLRRFGGHRAAAGLELDSAALADFREALAAHAAAALAPANLIAVEKVDAVVPAHALTLETADHLERLAPFGAGNPEPTLLVPAARVQAVAAMGDEGKHCRFTLATAAGRARAIVFGSSPGSLNRCTGDRACDIALKLERHAWNGMTEPRALVRAVCPMGPGQLEVLGEDEPFWSRFERELTADPRGPHLAPTVPSREVWDRRPESAVSVAVDLLTSGESVLIGVAEVPRRRVALEEVIASHAPDLLSVASWQALAMRPQLASGFRHVLALDPGPEGLLAALPGPGMVELAWGAPEIQFALAVWRSELELEPALREVWRALRDVDPSNPDQVERVVRGTGPFPRSPECCGRIVRVLSELGLVEVDPRHGHCRLLATERTELARSPAYRGYTARLEALRRFLGADGGRAVAAAA